jgi:hypothetical protein
MSAAAGPDLITDGLVLCLDSADKQSYTGSGSIWRDLTPNRNICILHGFPGVTFESEFMGSLRFNSASNQYASIDHSSSILPTSNMTWQIAIKFVTFPTYGALFNKADEFNSGGHIALYQFNNILRFQASDVIYTTRALDTGSGWNTTLTAGIYYILHLTYDGSNFRMYYNGALRHTTAWSFGLGNNAQPLWLGRFWAGYLNGNIAHFSIFNKTLNTNEIFQNNNILKRRFRL